MDKIGEVSAWTISVCQPASNLSRGSIPQRSGYVFLGGDISGSVH